MTIKYYICKSGTIRRKAEEYRSTYIQRVNEVDKLVKPLGADKYSLHEATLLVRGVNFVGAIPEGWHKPKCLGGYARPKPTKENAVILQHFTPHGVHFVRRPPKLQEFFAWLDFPVFYDYTVEGDTDRRGSSIVSFYNHELMWFSASSKIILALPDLEKVREEAKKERRIVVGGVLDWKTPKGLVEISKEEYAYLKAKHDWEQS